QALGTGVACSEIDLESGFLMMPQAIPQAAPAPEPTSPVPTPGTPDPTPVPSGPVPPASPAAERNVNLTFSGDRDQLFKAWPALANLANLAGQVVVTVQAESTDGFDRSKLQNGVFEPLREADLI